MQIKKSGKMETYEVVSRLIVGGRVYLPGASIELDTADGDALRMRGFIRPPRTKVAAIHEPNVQKEPKLKPNEVGIMTKDEQPSTSKESPLPRILPDVPAQESPDLETEEKPDAAKPGDTVPVDTKEKETPSGKPSRKNR